MEAVAFVTRVMKSKSGRVICSLILLGIIAWLISIPFLPNSGLEADASSLNDLLYKAGATKSLPTKASPTIVLQYLAYTGILIAVSVSWIFQASRFKETLEDVGSTVCFGVELDGKVGESDLALRYVEHLYMKLWRTKKWSSSIIRLNNLPIRKPAFCGKTGFPCSCFRVTFTLVWLMLSAFIVLAVKDTTAPNILIPANFRFGMAVSTLLSLVLNGFSCYECFVLAWFVHEYSSSRCLPYRAFNHKSPKSTYELMKLKRLVERNMVTFLIVTLGHGLATLIWIFMLGAPKLLDRKQVMLSLPLTGFNFGWDGVALVTIFTSLALVAYVVLNAVTTSAFSRILRTWQEVAINKKVEELGGDPDLEPSIVDTIMSKDPIDNIGRISLSLAVLNAAISALNFVLPYLF